MTSARPKENKAAIKTLPAKNEGSSAQIQCFKCFGRGHKTNQCPNRKALVLRDEEYYSEGDEEIPMDPGLDSDGDKIHEDMHAEIPPPPAGKFFAVSWRALTTTRQPEIDQKENIFQSRCLVEGQLLFVIVDGCSCANVVIQDVVKRLGLSTSRHATPYNLDWLNDYGAIKVQWQAIVRFEIGEYNDEMMFDVAPMQATHLLLGRPWQFDGRVCHYGGSNCYKVRHGGRKILLQPLTMTEVREYQRQLEDGR
ncbi:unnamed protein product [Linum trigynum]|uniref:CCHC-type domain-containing protein n=1 Tax=Linum trigynum TaxID=586398 RepID=A0AAV2GQ54_9ROSI